MGIINKVLSRIKKFFKGLVPVPREKKEQPTKLAPPQPLENPVEERIKKINPAKEYERIKKEEKNLQKQARKQAKPMNELKFEATHAGSDLKKRLEASERAKKPPKELMNYHDYYFIGEQVYESIKAMVADYQDRYYWLSPDRGQWILDLFEQKLQQYDWGDVLRSIGQEPEEVIYLCEQILNPSNDDMAARGYLYDLLMLITGHIPTLKEAKEAENKEESAENWVNQEMESTSEFEAKENMTREE